MKERSNKSRRNVAIIIEQIPNNKEKTTASIPLKESILKRRKTILRNEPKKYGIISHEGNERIDLAISGIGKR